MENGRFIPDQYIPWTEYVRPNKLHFTDGVNWDHNAARERIIPMSIEGQKRFQEILEKHANSIIWGTDSQLPLSNTNDDIVIDEETGDKYRWVNGELEKINE